MALPTAGSRFGPALAAALCGVGMVSVYHARPAPSRGGRSNVRARLPSQSARLLGAVKPFLKKLGIAFAGVLC